MADRSNGQSGYKVFRTVNCANRLLCTSELFLSDVDQSVRGLAVRVCVMHCSVCELKEFHGNKV